MAAQFSQTTRSLSSDSSRSAVIACLLAGLLLAGWTVWFFLGSVTVYEVSTRARLEVQQSSRPVSAQVAGMVVSATLAIGTQVRAGDVLVTLDDSSARLRLKEEETRLESIPRQVASLTREIESREKEKASDLRSSQAASEAARSRAREADAAVDFATDYQRRVTQLNANGLVSLVDLNRAGSESAKLTAARDSLSSDMTKIQIEAQGRVSQHDALIESLIHTRTSLEGEMATARATVERLAVDREQHLLRAPISGRLGDVVPVRPGAFVTQGQQLATIVPAGDLIVVADFRPSLTLGRVRAGQRGRLRLDGFPWTQTAAFPPRSATWRARPGTIWCAWSSCSTATPPAASHSSTGSRGRWRSAWSKPPRRPSSCDRPAFSCPTPPARTPWSLSRPGDDRCRRPVRPSVDRA